MLTALRDEVEFAWRRVFHRIYPWTALNRLDRKLQQHLPQRNGVFIEAGANDGVRQSNTYFLEKRRGWTGLLIEPVPRLAGRCRRARRRSTVIESLLVSPDNSGAFIRLLDLDLMTVIDDQASVLLDVESHVANAERVQHIRRESTTAQGFTLSHLIDNHQIPNVDLLSLDVEGYEVEVLHGLDLDRHRPGWILIETRAPAAVEALLLPLYELVAVLSHHDYLYALR